MPDVRTQDGLPKSRAARFRFFANTPAAGRPKPRAILTEDTVAIVLADTLTRGERSLVDMGERDHVLHTRRNHQRLMREDLVALVEEQTGRTMEAFFSDNQIDPDYAVEFMLLMPLPSDKPADPAAPAGRE